MKSIADKVDGAAVVMEVTKADLEGIAPILSNGFGVKTPNMVMHIYKNRRGKWNRVKIWSYADMGNVRVEDLFVTDNNYKIIPFELLDIIVDDQKQEHFDTKTTEEEMYNDMETVEKVEELNF